MRARLLCVLTALAVAAGMLSPSAAHAAPITGGTFTVSVPAHATTALPLASDADRASGPVYVILDLHDYRFVAGTISAWSNWQRAETDGAFAFLDLLAETHATTGPGYAAGPQASSEPDRINYRLCRVYPSGLTGDPEVDGCAQRSLLISVVSQPREQGDATAYTFEHLQNDDRTPYRWSRCSPIRVRVNPARGPADALSNMQLAIRQLAVATGLPFTYAGTTTRVPTYSAPVRRSVDGAEIVLAFAEPGTGTGRSDALRAGSSQLGVTLLGYAAGGNRFFRYTHAGIVFWASKMATLDGGPQGVRMAAYLHELGHAAGLDHSPDKRQTMYWRPDGSQLPASWGAGDRNGLRILGAAPCNRAPVASKADVTVRHGKTVKLKAIDPEGRRIDYWPAGRPKKGVITAITSKGVTYRAPARKLSKPVTVKFEACDRQDNCRIIRVAVRVT